MNLSKCVFYYSSLKQRKVMTRKAAAKNSRLLGEKKARVLVEFVLIIYRVLLFSYLSERERELIYLSL